MFLLVTLPVLVIALVVVVLVKLLEATARVLWMLACVIGPVLATVLAEGLHAGDARRRHLLESAAERHANGGERRQELAAQAALRLARYG